MKDGLMSICKSCRKVQQTDWDRKNTGRRRHLKSHLKKQYGISIEEYDRMRQEQLFSCKICGKHEDDSLHGRLCVDHCHSTGKVRGLLCNKCNSAIGLLNEDTNTLAAAIEYLSR